jgi:hypothetical protein
MLMKRFIWFFILSSLLCSCKDGQPQPVESDFYGTWEFYDVLRNGRSSTTLNSGYIAFYDDQSVESNIFQVEEEKRFEIEGDKLSIFGADEGLYLKVMKMQNDSMHLNGRVWMFDMDFYLVKITYDSIPDSNSE